MIISDEQIVSKILSGDIECYRVLVEKYENKIYSVGYRFFKNNCDASDFVQEVFIKAYQCMPSYSGTSPFKNWLLKIAYNYGIDQISKIKATTTYDGDYMESDDDHPEDHYVKNEIIDVIHKAVQDLPENYQICVDLYFFWGMKHKEISDITGIPVNTIKSNVLRAKQLLKENLKGTIAEDYYEM